MNIAFGKIGRTIYFDRSSWLLFKGDEEAPLLFTMLAKRYPQHTFYAIGNTDLKSKRVDASVPENIIDILVDYPRDVDKHLWLADKVKRLDIKFDLAIIYMGINKGIAIPGTLTLEGKPAEVRNDYRQSVAHILHILNETNVPWFGLCGDPRQIPITFREILNSESFILSQVDMEYKTKRNKRVDSWREEDIYMHTLKYIYSGIETIFLLDENLVDFRDIEKDIKFSIALCGSDDREKIMREWFFNRRDEIWIYGDNWSDEFMRDFGRWVVNKTVKQVESTFWRTRYTLIPPFSYNRSTFVTQKFWKMIYYGIIPFFHPKYDTAKIFDVPDYLRVSTPTEMWKKIDELDANPEKRKQILNHIYTMLLPQYFNGDFLDHVINEASFKTCGKRLTDKWDNDWQGDVVHQKTTNRKQLGMF